MFKVSTAEISDENIDRPNLYFTHKVLNAWSKSKKSIIGAKSSEILNTMQKLSERGDFHVKPDNVSGCRSLDCNLS